MKNKQKLNLKDRLSVLYDIQFISNGMNNKIKKILILISSFVLYFCFFNVTLAATEYTLLEKLPVIGGSVSGFGPYLIGMFKLLIGLAIVLAVLQLAIGGFEYLTTEAFTGKSDARKKIIDAIFGLILILSSYLILKTVNPDLVDQELIIPPVGNLKDGWEESNEEDVQIQCREYNWLGIESEDKNCSEREGFLLSGNYVTQGRLCGASDRETLNGRCCVYSNNECLKKK